MRHGLWRQKNELSMRTEQEVFDELGTLCLSPGFIHVIPYCCMRDNMIGYAGDEMKAEDMANLHENSRLIRTEISALLAVANVGKAKIQNDGLLLSGCPILSGR